MLVGSDEANYQAVEAAIGRKVDILRTYDRTGGGNYDRLKGFAAAGYFLLSSKKFCTQNGTPIPATQISASLAPGAPKDAINSDYDTWNAVVAALDGVKIPEHEEDAKSAAGSGGAAALNAAIDAFVARYPDNAHCSNGVCWTGWDLINREPLYRAAGIKVKNHVLDPYAGKVPGPSLVASYGQDFNWLNKIYPGNVIWLGEINAPVGGPAGAQAAWLNQARADMEAQYPMIRGACLWQDIGAHGNLSETAAELALMKSGFFAPHAPAPTPTPAPAPALAQVDAAKLRQIKQLVDAL